MTTGTEIVRFSIAGAIVMATDFSVYYLLSHSVSFNSAKAISFLCAGIVGYGFNKWWTFRHHVSSYFEVGRYIFINVLALGMNVFINHYCLKLWPSAMALALVMATTVTSVFTFVCFKWWVFNNTNLIRK